MDMYKHIWDDRNLFVHGASLKETQRCPRMLSAFLSNCTVFDSVLPNLDISTHHALSSLTMGGGNIGGRIFLVGWHNQNRQFS